MSSELHHPGASSSTSQLTPQVLQPFPDASHRQLLAPNLPALNATPLKTHTLPASMPPIHQDNPHLECEQCHIMD